MNKIHLGLTELMNMVDMISIYDEPGLHPKYIADSIIVETADRYIINLWTDFFDGTYLDGEFGCSSSGVHVRHLPQGVRYSERFSEGRERWINGLPKNLRKTS